VKNILALVQLFPAIFDVVMKIEDLAKQAVEKVSGATKQQAVLDILKLAGSDIAASVISAAIDLAVTILNAFGVFKK